MGLATVGRSRDHNGSTDTGQTFLYFGWLTLFLYLATPTGYLVDIQTSYMLKNQLHATATQISMFRLMTGIPVYFAFAFGLMRDQWNPFGLRDRGFFLIFAPATAMAFIWMAIFAPLLPGTADRDVAGDAVVPIHRGGLSRADGPGGPGKADVRAPERAVEYRQLRPVIAGAFASGYISEHLPPKRDLLPGGGIHRFDCRLRDSGSRVPSSAMPTTSRRPEARILSGNVKRLVKHRAVYPAVLICFLWNFAPGAATPLQFYLTNQLHASDAVYSYYNGIFAAAFIPTFLLYGFLCKKVALNKLLWWGTIVAVPQMIPLAFIHSGQPRAGVGRADRLDGRRRHGGLLRSGDAVLSAGPAGNLDDAGGRRLRCCPRAAATCWARRSTTAARRMDSSTA